MFQKMTTPGSGESGSGIITVSENVIYDGALKRDFTESNPWIVQGDFSDGLLLYCKGSYYYTGQYYSLQSSLYLNTPYEEPFYLLVGLDTYHSYRKVTLYEDRIVLGGCYTSPDDTTTELTNGYGGITYLSLIQRSNQ